jgi:hypothetical protein
MFNFSVREHIMITIFFHVCRRMAAVHRFTPQNKKRPNPGAFCPAGTDAGSDTQVGRSGRSAVGFLTYFTLIFLMSVGPTRSPKTHCDMGYNVASEFCNAATTNGEIAVSVSIMVCA